MNAQNRSKRTIVVRLPAEPRTSDELETVTQVALNEPDCDVVMDFADIQTLSQPTLCGLVILHRALGDTGRRLSFCNTEAVRDVFKAHRIGRVLTGDCDEGIILEPMANPGNGGTLVRAHQDETGTCERRHYVRLNVSRSLKLTVLAWHACQDHEVPQSPQPPCWRGMLVDVSEGGAQVAIDLAQEPTFHKKQFMGLQFAPMPYEPPITFGALVREVLPTADGEQICLGVQFAGLEANGEGRRGLQRLCSIQGRYFQTTETPTV